MRLEQIIHNFTRNSGSSATNAPAMPPPTVVDASSYSSLSAMPQSAPDDARLGSSTFAMAQPTTGDARPQLRPAQPAAQSRVASQPAPRRSPAARLARRIGPYRPIVSKPVLEGPSGPQGVLTGRGSQTVRTLGAAHRNTLARQPAAGPVAAPALPASAGLDGLRNVQTTDLAHYKRLMAPKLRDYVLRALRNAGLHASLGVQPHCSLDAWSGLRMTGGKLFGTCDEVTTLLFKIADRDAISLPPPHAGPLRPRGLARVVFGTRVQLKNWLAMDDVLCITQEQQPLALRPEAVPFLTVEAARAAQPMNASFDWAALKNVRTPDIMAFTATLRAKVRVALLAELAVPSDDAGFLPNGMYRATDGKLVATSSQMRRLIETICACDSLQLIDRSKDFNAAGFRALLVQPSLQNWLDLPELVRIDG